MDRQEKPLTFEHEGRFVSVRKQRLHQWRTDLALRVDCRAFVIGREEAPMTRCEAKRLARGWLEGRRIKAGL